MGDPLSILASSFAIVDGLKEAARFAKDVIKADDEREEFLQRFNCVNEVTETLDTCLAGEMEKDITGQLWFDRLDPTKNPKSPLAGLQETLSKMVKILKLKETTFKQRMKNFEWHSEKKSLESLFSAIDGYCIRIVMILSARNLSGVRENITITQKIAAMMEEDQKAKKVQLEEEQRKRIEQWLSPLEFPAQQRKIYRKSARTGQWFLDLPEFKCWEQGEFRTLRCYGKSGAGKTVLSSIIVEHLTDKLSPAIPILCIYLEKTPSFPHTATNLLGSLLKQLVQLKESGVSEPIVDAYTKAIRFNWPTSEEELRKLLQDELKLYSRVHIIVDALDESTDESRDFVEKNLITLSPEILKILNTARPDEEPSRNYVQCDDCQKRTSFYYRCQGCPRSMEERYDLCYTCYTNGTRCTRDSRHAFKFPNSFAVTIKMPLIDLEKYVVEEIEKQMCQAPEADTDEDMLPSGASTTTLGYECSKSQEFFNAIVSTITRNADGRFLLAFQYTKSLANQMTPRDIDDAIKEMKENRHDISETINKLYEQDMQWVTEQESGKRKLAIRVLSWVSGTYRNLNLMELKHALATYVGDSVYDNKGEPALKNILNATKGLIEVGGDETVRLTHRTLKEYFNKRGNYWFENGQIEIAKACLTYLSFDTFAKRCLPEEFSAKEAAHPFFTYAIEFWGDHVRKAGPEAEAAAVRYLKNPVQVEAYIQAAWMANTQDTDKWDCRRSISPLHICAWFDLWYLISALEYQTLNLDVQEGTYGQTPLMYACRRGHAETVARLLYLGASSDIVSGRGRTALTEAVLRGWKEIVNLLLNPDLVSQKLDINALYPKMFNRTPLMLAIRLGFTDISLAILKHPDVLINKQDSEGNTALSLAAYLGMEQVVKEILLKTDVDVDLRDYGGGYSALSWAAQGNHTKVVELLVGDGADPNLKDKRGGTAALRAVEEGSMEALKKLFDSSVDLSCQDENGSTLLHAAAEKGHTDIVSVLHEKMLEINVPDRDGATPLHCACRSGQYKAAELLLELGADSSVKDTFKRTPFIVAAQYGQTELKMLCREKGTDREADVGLNLQEENLPIWSLVRLRRLELIEAALVSRAEEVNVKEPGLNNTALHWAIIPNENDDKDPLKKHQILRKLLSAGDTYLNEPDNNGQSPLHMAAIHGDQEATKILLEHNAEVDKEDKFGLTPLIIATENEAFDLAMILIEADASIDGSKVDVEKLLFAAISLQHNLAAMNLIRAGADPLAQDENGRTVVMMAEMMAKRSGDRALLSFLQSQPSMKYQVRRKTEMKSDTGVAEVELFGGVTPSEIAFRPFRSPHMDLEQGELLHA